VHGIFIFFKSSSARSPSAIFFFLNERKSPSAISVGPYRFSNQHGIFILTQIRSCLFTLHDEQRTCRSRHGPRRAIDCGQRIKTSQYHQHSGSTTTLPAGATGRPWQRSRGPRQVMCARATAPWQLAWPGRGRRAGAGCCAHLHRLAPFRPPMMPTLSTAYRVARFSSAIRPPIMPPIHSTTRSPIPQRHRRENPSTPPGGRRPLRAACGVRFHLFFITPLPQCPLLF